MPTLSIIIPAYNEGATLGEMLRRIEAAPLPAGWAKELIIVNDGSTDNTKQIAQDFAASHTGDCAVRYIPQAVNCGKGACIRLSVAAASGEAIPGSGCRPGI